MPGHPTRRQRVSAPPPAPSPRPWPVLVAGAALAWLPAAQAQTALGTSGGVLPVLGSDVRVGDIRPQLESFFAGQTTTAQRPNWIVTPGLDVQVGATDNADRLPRGHSDVFTIITPQVVVSGETVRLKVNAAYNPTVTEYASTSSQNSINQFFNGNVHFIGVPDLFFIDMRGSITQQSLTNGGFNGTQGTQSYNNQDDVQTITVSISPYFERKFGGYGTAHLGYTFSRTLQDLNDGNNNGLSGNNAYGSAGNLTTNLEQASFNTGENFGRYNDQVTISATQYAGAGTYQGAYRNEVSNQVGFAIDHTFTVFGSLGYQDIHYGSGYNINGPSYSVGMRYAPNPDTNITIEYGRHDGDDNLGFQGQVAITPRLRLVSQYSTGITSDLEQAQTNLGATSVTTNGSLVNTVTGAPTTNSTGFSGLQDGIYRLKRLSASLLYLRDRDSYTLTLNNDNRTSLSSATTLIGGAVVPAGTNTSSTYASLSWQHDLTPDIRTNVTAQYGITNSTSRYVGGNNGDQRTLSASASISRQFTETLSGTLRYVYYDQTGGQSAFTSAYNTGNYSSNTIIISLHKSF